jgi:hypothetical protein
VDRVLRGTAATVYLTLAIDGTATDPTPDTAIVSATRADGTVLQAPIAAADAGEGRFGFTFSTSQTALLDTVTLTWTASVAGIEQTFQTTVEIVGGFLFSINEARARGLTDTTAYPAETIVRKRTLIEQRLEKACGVAFVPRYALQTWYGAGDYVLSPQWPMPYTIRSVTRGTTPVTPAGSAAWIQGGNFQLSSGWSYRAESVTIGYEHGHLALPEPARDAALDEAVLSLSQASSGQDPRIASYSTDDGSVRYFDPGATGTAGFSSQLANQFVNDWNMSVFAV